MITYGFGTFGGLVTQGLGADTIVYIQSPTSIPPLKLKKVTSGQLISVSVSPVIITSSPSRYAIAKNPIVSISSTRVTTVNDSPTLVKSSKPVTVQTNKTVSTVSKKVTSQTTKKVVTIKK